MTQNRGHELKDQRKPKALIVDDSSDCLHLYKAIVEGLGCETHAVGDGRQALGKIREHNPFDVILLDLDMPLMNGIRFYNELRTLGLHSQARIILTSSHPFAADISTALDFFAHAPKNTHSDTLRAIVLKALG